MGSGTHVTGDPERLVTASMAFARMMLEHLSACAAKVGLPKQQAYALHLLAHEPELSMSGLGDRLGADPSTVSGLVDRLEARGLLVRHPASDDRRVKMLTVTALRLELDAQVDALVRTHGPCHGTLSPDQEGTLTDLLERVVAHAQEPCRRTAR